MNIADNTHNTSALALGRIALCYADGDQVLELLFNVSLQGDDIQDFDTRWDEALLSASEMPKDNVLDSLNTRSLFSFRLYQRCTNKRLIETERCQSW